MVMYREDARGFLAATIRELLQQAGIASTDAEGQLKEPIDEALLAMGVAYGSIGGATVADVDVLGFRRVLTLAGLLRVRSAFVATAIDPDVSGAVKVLYSKRIELLDKQIASASALAATYIVDADSSQWGAGVVTFGDYLEPVPS